MQIDPKRNVFRLPEGSKKGSGRIRRLKETKEFQKDLKSSLREEIKQRLRVLLTDIESQGKDLIKRRDLESVLKYKNLVKEFLAIIIKNVYLLKEKSNLTAKGKHNVFVLIENADKALEELAKIALDKEVDNLKILEKVGEIKGILIDIYS